MRVSRAIWHLSACLFVLSVAPATLAQNTQDTQDAQDTQDTQDTQEQEARAAEARVLFTEGVALAEEERYAEAAVRFRAAYLLRRAAPIAYNFGNALVESGRLVEGSEMLRQVIRNPQASRELRQRAEEAIRECEPRIGTLIVNVTGEPEGATVSVGGSPIDTASYGVPISADPGENEVVATRGGETVASTTVEVSSGESAEVTLDVPAPVEAPEVVAPLVAPTPARAPVDDGGGIGTKWWFWTLVVLAVGGGVLAGILIATGGQVEGAIAGTTQPGILTWD